MLTIFEVSTKKDHFNTEAEIFLITLILESRAFQARVSNELGPKFRSLWIWYVQNCPMQPAPFRVRKPDPEQVMTSPEEIKLTLDS